MYAKKVVQHMVIDTTGTYTELCEIAAKIGIDKSPYTKRDGAHRHPYTGVYSMLFSPLKNKEIRFAEIGIAGGGSVILWNHYFKQAKFHFFDCDEGFLNNSRSFGLPGSTFERMDVSKDGDIKRALGTELYDVILDDSSHLVDDQIRIIKEAFPVVKSGGYIIIEDIYRTESEEKYINALKDVLHNFSEAYFVVCNHEERYSPGWNNDKLLVLVRA